MYIIIEINYNINAQSIKCHYSESKSNFRLEICIVTRLWSVYKTRVQNLTCRLYSSHVEVLARKNQDIFSINLSKISFTSVRFTIKLKTH